MVLSKVLSQVLTGGKGDGVPQPGQGYPFSQPGQATHPLLRARIRAPPLFPLSLPTPQPGQGTPPQARMDILLAFKLDFLVAESLHTYSLIFFLFETHSIYDCFIIQGSVEIECSATYRTAHQKLSEPLKESARVSSGQKYFKPSARNLSKDTLTCVRLQ